MGVTGCGILGFFAIGGMFAFRSLHQNLAPIFTTLQGIIPRGFRVEALIKFILEQLIHYYTFLLIWKKQKLSVKSDSKPSILVSCFLPMCQFLLMKLFVHRFVHRFARKLFMYHKIINPINNHICLLYFSN